MQSSEAGKPVLIATDLSEGADEVIRQGDALARDAGAPLVVVHVLPELYGIHPLFPQMNLPAAFSLASVERRAAEAVAERVVGLTGRRLAVAEPEEDADGRAAAGDAGRFEVRLRTGSPHDGILGEAEAAGAALIVVGAHGGGLEGILGNVTRQVVRHARADVLVVRGEPARRPGPVLVATDFSEHAAVAIETARRAARRLGRGLTLLYSLDFIPQRYPVPLSDAPLPSTSDLAEVQRELGRMLESEAARVGADPVLRVGPASRVIAETAGELGSPLVVVGTHGRTGIGRLALGSVAEKVVERAPCSVLVAR